MSERSQTFYVARVAEEPTLTQPHERYLWFSNQFGWKIQPHTNPSLYPARFQSAREAIGDFRHQSEDDRTAKFDIVKRTTTFTVTDEKVDSA